MGGTLNETCESFKNIIETACAKPDDGYALTLHQALGHKILNAYDPGNPGPEDDDALEMLKYWFNRYDNYDSPGTSSKGYFMLEILYAWCDGSCLLSTKAYSDTLALTTPTAILDILLNYPEHFTIGTHQYPRCNFETVEECNGSGKAKFGNDYQQFREYWDNGLRDDVRPGARPLASTHDRTSRRAGLRSNPAHYSRQRRERPGNQLSRRIHLQLKRLMGPPATWGPCFPSFPLRVGLEQESLTGQFRRWPTLETSRELFPRPAAPSVFLHQGK